MSGHAQGNVGTKIQVSTMNNAVMSVSTQQNLIKLSSDETENRVSSSLELSVSNDTLSNSNRIWTSLAAGAIAGGAAKTSIAPLDRTKINFQTSQQPFSTKAAIEFIIKTYQKDGLLSLWRGNSATMVRIVPYAAIQFTTYEQWKRILKVDESEGSKERRFLAGAIAGLISQAITYPLDLARAQMAVTQKDEYKTLRQVFTHIYKKEGLIAFYRGFTPTILGVIPYAGCSFFFYDTIKNSLTVYTASSPGLTAMSGLVSGAIAGMIGQASSYPLDIVRRRMQTSAVKNQQSLGIIKMTMKIYGEDGIMSFYKGLSMNWVKGPVAVGISFATYDVMKDLLRKIFC